MHLPLVQIIAFAAIRGQLGVALPNQLKPLHVRSINPTVDKGGRINFNHIDDNPVHERSYINFDHFDNVGLDDRAVTPPPARPQNPSKPGHVPASGHQGSLSANLAKFKTKWEVLSSNDQSDLIKVKSCKAKRGELVRDPIFHTNGKRGDDEKAQPWSVWQQVLKSIDDDIAELHKGRIEIYAIGGFSAVALGTREKTGDLDFVQKREPGAQPNPNEEEALEIAFEKTYRRPEFKIKLEKSYMNDDVEQLLSEPAHVYISANSPGKAYEGARLTVSHAPWDLQLVMKLVKVDSYLSADQSILAKDLADAKMFLERATDQGKVKITSTHTKYMGEYLGLPGSAIQKAVGRTARLIDPELASFEQEIANWVKEAGC